VSPWEIAAKPLPKQMAREFPMFLPPLVTQKVQGSRQESVKSPATPREWELGWSASVFATVMATVIWLDCQSVSAKTSLSDEAKVLE